MEEEKSSLIHNEGEPLRGSVWKKSLEDPDKEVLKVSPSKPSTSSSNVRTYSSGKNEEQEYDNMRGFDPASEDDMDDNGMSRYMENNDEEGWD